MHKRNCRCSSCKNDIPFDIPPDLIDAIMHNELVVFAGAGISTESNNVMPYTLYKEIKDEIDCQENISFAKLMSEYCKHPRSKVDLIRKIKKRFDYVTSFDELLRQASSFHKLLSSFHQIDTIITTNWDDLFEKYCGAIPIVTPEDYSLWNINGRKVIKIHGSINNLGTIVATEEDYLACLERLKERVIGSTLKHILATKHILFVGYSFRDEDFNIIYETLLEEMKDYLPHSYFVTIDDYFEPKFRDFTVIKTDAIYFIKNIKEYFESKNLIISSELFYKLEALLEMTISLHTCFSEKLDLTKYPEGVYCLMYQDGIIHALERALSLRYTGKYTDFSYIRSAICLYQKIKKDMKLKHRYFDYAYVQGYLAGLKCMNLKEDFAPFFFVMNYSKPINHPDKYFEIVEQTRNSESDIYKAAKEDVNLTYSHGDLVPQHIPML